MYLCAQVHPIQNLKPQGISQWRVGGGSWGLKAQGGRTCWNSSHGAWVCFPFMAHSGASCSEKVRLLPPHRRTMLERHTLSTLLSAPSVTLVVESCNPVLHVCVWLLSFGTSKRFSPMFLKWAAPILAIKPNLSMKIMKGLVVKYIWTMWGCVKSELSSLIWVIIPRCVWRVFLPDMLKEIGTENLSVFMMADPHVFGFNKKLVEKWMPGVKLHTQAFRWHSQWTGASLYRAVVCLHSTTRCKAATVAFGTKECGQWVAGIKLQVLMLLILWNYQISQWT